MMETKQTELDVLVTELEKWMAGIAQEETKHKAIIELNNVEMDISL